MKIIFEKEEQELSDLWFTKDIFKALVHVYKDEGKVNLEKMSRITQLNKDQILDLLDPYLFQDPSSFDENHDKYDSWLLKEEYLTGNIVQKLEIATVFNQKYGGYFQKNVDVLKKWIHPISYQNIMEAFPLLHHEFENYIKESNCKDKYKYHTLASRIVSGEWEESSLNHETINTEMKLWVNYLIRNQFFESYGGYMTWVKEKDPFFQILLNEKNIVVQRDVEQRMYTILFSAALVIDYHLATSVTIVVGNTLKKCLINLKNELYPTLPIEIVTSRLLTKNETCVFVDESAEIKTKVIKQLKHLNRICFFLSCLNASLLKKIYELFYFRLYSNSSILKDCYTSGYISTSQKCHNYSVYTIRLESKWELVQLLSPILSILPCDYSLSLRSDESSHQYIKEDEFICEQYLEGQHVSVAKLIFARIKYAQLSKVDNMLLNAFFDDGVQLIYVDQNEMMNLVKVGLQSFGVREEEIQVIKQAGMLKKAKYYIAKPKSVYPFQIPKLTTVHHMEPLKDLSNFYDSLSHHLHIVYLTSDSIDTFYLQELYHQERFFSLFTEEQKIMKLLYQFFSSSHSVKALKNTEQKKVEILDSLQQQIIYSQNSRKFDSFYYDYVKLKKRKQWNREIDGYMHQTYFNHKESYLFSLGNYHVFLPRDMLESHPYLLLKSPSNQEIIYRLKVGDNHIEKIIDLLREETDYE